mgnify:CR=1 FL=1
MQSFLEKAMNWQGQVDEASPSNKQRNWQHRLWRSTGPRNRLPRVMCVPKTCAEKRVKSETSFIRMGVMAKMLGNNEIKKMFI